LRYLLYGLRVDADRAIPGLRPVEDAGPADVRVWIGSHPPGSVPAGAPPWYVADRELAGEPAVVARGGGGAGYRLRYADGCEFTVDMAGTRVGCTWPAETSLEDAATYLLGPVFGLVLRVRGVTCLHASAVEVGGRAVLLSGPAGAGKSTTAAALALRGHRPLADDVAALDPAPGGGATVRPAYPHLRLWPDAVQALYGPDADLPPLTPNWDKRLLDLHTAPGLYHSDPLPVCAVFRLAGREAADAPRLESVAPAEAVLTLVGDTYLGWLPALHAQARDLAAYAALARRVPVLRAVPHTDPARLDELCALIEDASAEGGRG